MIKVTIDRDECISCGNCFENYPEFFGENPDDNFAQIIEKYRVGGSLDVGEAPEELRDRVQGAAEECPVEIIHVE